jgi:hypothetical protein
MQDYVKYLGGKLTPSKSELKLFPFLLTEYPFDGGRLDDLKPMMLQDRFRWLCQFYKLVDPNDLLKHWLDPNPIAVERATHKEESFEEFSKNSWSFGLQMLRDEIQYFKWFCQLQMCLKERVYPSDKVVVLGPTAGGEIEAVSAAGVTPYYLSRPEWLTCVQAESRLLSDRIVFESIEWKDLGSMVGGFKYAILTPYVGDDTDYIRLLYDSIGLYGYLGCPSSCIKLTEEMESLGMYRLDPWRSEISFYYKYPGLPLIAGERCSLQKWNRS